MKKELPSYIANRLSVEDLASSRGLLQLIDRLGMVSQRQAAEELGLSPGTCNLHFQKLEHMGLIHRAAEVTGRGRSTIQWEIEQKKNACIEIVFDVPFFLATLTDFKGTLLLSEREDLSGLDNAEELEKLIDRFIGKAKQLAKESSISIRQVFLGLPGILDPTHSKVLQAVNFPVLEGVDFKALTSERHDLPCQCGCLGKAFYHGEIEPFSPDTRSMVLFWDLGIGVVAGVGERIISHDNGDLALSELGHVRIVKNGNICHCGRKGCLEAYVGGQAMIEKLDRDDITSLNDLLLAITTGDAEALKVANDAARTLAQNLCWPIQVMECDRLIISGPLSPIFEYVRPAIIEGLGNLFSDEEIAQLNPQASNDPQLAMQRGAA
ncbi:MAG: ROK family transcriptional regulator, partial [Verrucomicrobiota bacterium]